MLAICYAGVVTVLLQKYSIKLALPPRSSELAVLKLDAVDVICLCSDCVVFPSTGPMSHPTASYRERLDRFSVESGVYYFGKLK